MSAAAAHGWYALITEFYTKLDLRANISSELMANLTIEELYMETGHRLEDMVLRWVECSPVSNTTRRKIMHLFGNLLKSWSHRATTRK